MIGDYIEAGRQSLLRRGIQAVRGAETGTVVRANRAYIDSIQIEMRMIGAPEHPGTDFTLFGRRLRTPVMSGALSGLNNIRPNGMEVLAQGMAAAGSCVWAGIGTDEELARLTASGAPVIKIIKPYRNQDLIFQKLEQAEKLGCLAVGMDTDFFFGSQVGEKLTGVDMVSPKTAAELRSYIEATRLPFIFKGVLSERDARLAMDIGAGGIVVSSHSGSVMDYAVPALRMLPRIAKIVDGRVPLFVDGDVKRGTDVFKALALGADGVLAGRALMAGMELDGADGVAKVVDGITEELRRVMGQTGCAALEDIEPSVLWMP